MAIMTFQGTVENGRVRLGADVLLPENARVYVVVPDFEADVQTSKFNLSEMVSRMPLDFQAEEKERSDWYRLSMQNFAAAYGEDEPEYTLDEVKEINPDYEGR